MSALRAHDYAAGLPYEQRVEEELRALHGKLDLIVAQIKTRIEPRLLTVEQAGAYVGRTRKGVEHLIAQNAFATVRYGDRVHVDRRDLDEWITRNRF